jgi:hypothetical protein
MTDKLPLERFTVYWHDGYYGMCFNAGPGTIDGVQMQKQEVVRADLYDAALARIAELEARVDALEDPILT